MPKHPIEFRAAPTRTVAVFLGWYDQRILAGFARFAKKKRWAVVFDFAMVHQWSNESLQVDGILCMIGPEPKAAEIIKKMNVPTVVLNQGDEGLLENFPRVTIDDGACGQMAADYFLGLGYENFLTIGKNGRTFFRDRIKGFIEAVEAKGHDVKTVWLGESLSRARMKNPIEAALKSVSKPVAVFVPADVTSVHVISCALALGLHVPEEVSVLGTDNQEMICEYAPVPLSSIRAGITALGYEGAKLLDKVMNGNARKAEAKVLAPIEVIVRQSTNSVAVPDIRVARAIRFIADHLDQPIGVGKVASEVGLSRSQLGQLFRQHLDRTIIEEISRVRIEKAKSLLRTGNLSAKRVALACGFNSPNYFNNIFVQTTGTTPNKYRNHCSRIL
jgi:LacI family transcriptional regulator